MLFGRFVIPSKYRSWASVGCSLLICGWLSINIFLLRSFSGNPLNPFIQPYVTNPVLEPLPFFNRVLNVLGELIVHTIYFKVAFRWEAASVREKFPSLPDPYDIYDMDRSIMTVDQSHVVTHGSWPKYQASCRIYVFTNTMQNADCVSAESIFLLSSVILSGTY